MSLALTIIIVFIILCAAEWWWRKHDVHDEFSRKLVHIVVGSFVAFWPFFLSWHQIIFLSVAFLLVISLSKYLNVFQAIHNVQRPTLGEVFFALAVGGVALLTHDKWIYMAALLQMSLADGLAAITGVTWGQRTNYKIVSQTKSLVGTGTFMLVSVIILSIYSVVSGAPLAVPVIVGLAFVAGLIENVGIRGLDNLLVPLAIACALQLLK